MSDIHIRITGRAGRITLDRPRALNALTYDQALRIEAALEDWIADDAVACVLIDAAGEKAFCAGGDLQAMYDTASAGDFSYGRQFWRDEYRLNALIHDYPKPYVALMQGFVMGGGVGISCHGSHRIVCESSRIAMPECGVGLIPDVGGSLLLARAPGHLGEYLGMTGTRMTGADAILAGFADSYVPRAHWAELTARIERSGAPKAEIDALATAPEPAPLAAFAPRIDRCFGQDTLGDILASLGDDPWADTTRKALRRGAPLSVACTHALVRDVRGLDAIRPALTREYRFTSRAASEGDFIEGIRAIIIDKDMAPRWKHPRLEDVTPAEVGHMLSPLTGPELTFEKEGQR